VHARDDLAPSPGGASAAALALDGRGRFSVASVSSDFTTPVPRHTGQCWVSSARRSCRTRLRVISTRPSSEIGITLVRALSSASARLMAFSTCSRLLEHLHVDEVDDDDAAEIAQPDLADHLVDRLQVGLEHGLLEVALADVLPGVHVDGDQRLGVVDDDVAPDFSHTRRRRAFSMSFSIPKASNTGARSA